MAELKKSRAAQMIEIMKARESRAVKPVIRSVEKSAPKIGYVPGKPAKVEEAEREDWQQQTSSLFPSFRAPEPAQVKPDQKEKFSLRGSLYRKLKSKGKTISIMRSKEKLTKYPKFMIIPQAKFTSITSLKETPSKSTMYPLINPYAYANIVHDPVHNEFVYNVVEPELDEYERHVLEKLKDGLMQVINVSLEDIKKQDKMIDFLENNVRALLNQFDFNMDENSYLKIMYYIARDFIGMNEIEPMLRDPFIEDIGCDGTSVPVYVVHQRYGSLRSNVVFNDEKVLKEYVTKLAERSDRYISYAEPLLDGTLPDGTRVHASLAGDVTTRGPTFSIRKFRETPFTPVDIVRFNTASSEMLAYLWFLVESGVNILITGGVATGKTSFLNTLSLFIPSEAKVVSIEDTRELSLPHENWIPGVARVGFTGTGIGEVTMFDLLKESFRQNPDYLIVGEIRGKEAYVMFQSMASGHPSMSTMHAGSVDDVVKRLQTEPMSISPGLLDALDIIIVMIHAREKGKSARRVKEVIEIESIDTVTGRPRDSKVFVWLPSVDSFEYIGDSWVLHKISTEKGMPMNHVIKEIIRRKKIINWMVENNINQISEVAKYISMYHTNPEGVKHILGETY